MRILFVVHGFPPEATGGTEIYASDLAQALWRRGHEVIVLAREARTDEPEYRVHRDRAGEVAVLRVNHTFRDATSFEHTYRNAKIDAIAGTLLDEERPDVVHVHHLTCLSTGHRRRVRCARHPVRPDAERLLAALPSRPTARPRVSRAALGPSPDRCAACAGLSASGQPAMHLAARGLRAIERHAPKVLADAQRRLVVRDVEAYRSGVGGRRSPPAASSDTKSVCESATRILAPSRTLLEQFERFGIQPSRMSVQSNRASTRGLSPDLPVGPHRSAAPRFHRQPDGLEGAARPSRGCRRPAGRTA